MKKSISVFALIMVFATISCKKNKENGNEATTTNEQKTEEVYVDKNGFSNTETTVKAENITVMSFSSLEHNFGDIKQGTKVDKEFTFKNTGTKDLIITDAKGSCGCTVPEYPKEAVKPSESGTIKVSFNSDGKSGPQAKTVTIFANTEKGSEILTIKSNVITN